MKRTVFAPEGYVIIAWSLVIGVILIVGGLYLGGNWKYVLFALAVLLVSFVLFFFRDPDRTPPENAQRLVLAPADGKVIEIRKEHEPIYFKGPAIRISIFLSPLDVHVNRIPAEGIIDFVDYVPGEYLVAWHPKASEKNERSIIGLRHPCGYPVLFKQIAGFIARRIVFHVEKGDTVSAGERFGIVKFGSRMDVFIPLEAELKVKEGDRVRAGETILAELPPCS